MPHPMPGASVPSPQMMPTSSKASQTTASSSPLFEQVTAGKTILTPADVARVVDRIAHQILEKTSGAADAVLLGIPTRGVPLARRLAAPDPRVRGRRCAGGCARHHSLPG